MHRIFCLCLCLPLTIASTKAQHTVGLFLNDSLAFNGYTLFAPNSNGTTYLIDNCGNKINTWVSAHNPGLSAYLLDNGDLLRTARINSSIFMGGGSAGKVERFDWDGNLTWSYTYSGSKEHSHHDVEFLPNGNVLMIAWESVTGTAAINAGRDPGTVGSALWPDHIIELEPIGADSANIVWEWHAFDHLIQDFDSTKPNYGVVADHPEKFDLNYIGGAASGQDWMHINSIDYNAELDQILLSSRHWDEIWVIDHSTTTAEAAGSIGGNSGKGGDILYRWGNPAAYDRGTSGNQQLYGQHDAQWIEAGYPGEGNIIVFNNGIGRPGDDYSQVDEIVPPVDESGNYLLDDIDPFGPATPTWTYLDIIDPTDFYSTNISGVERLPNGHTLICEGTEGRFFEVDNAGKIHWEYISPVGFGGPVSQGLNAIGNGVFRVRRYSPDYAAFDGRDLTPGEPVELDPDVSDCMIYESPVTGIDHQEILAGLRVFPNPAVENIWIQNSDQFDLTIHLYDGTGRLAYSNHTQDNLFQITISDLPSGIYLLETKLDSRHITGAKTWKILIP